MTELNRTGEGTEAQGARAAGSGLQSSEQAEPGLKFFQSDNQTVILMLLPP